jgi:predicted DNA-binding transcriptional regulator AlpA
VNNEPTVKLVSETEAMELLKYTRTSMYRFRKSGQLPFVPIGDGPRPSIRYRSDDLAEFMGSRRTIPATQGEAA